MFLHPYWQKSCPVNWFAWHVFTSSVSTHTFTGLIGFTGVIGFTSRVALEAAMGVVVGAVVAVAVRAFNRNGGRAPDVSKPYNISD